MRANQRLVASDGYEVALFPLEYLNMSQDEGADYSHQGTYNIDLLGWDSNGRKYSCPVYAPCTMKVVDFWNSYGGGNNVVYESVNKVHLPNGQLDYLTIAFGHDPNPPHTTIGEVVQQGSICYHTGTYGNVTGDHTHTCIGQGHYQGYTTRSSGHQDLTNRIHYWEGVYVNDTSIINGYSHNWNTWTTTWVSEDRYLNQSEMENNANIIINYYRGVGINDNTIAAILGNMQAESTLSPILNEVGGSGYGLVQWTPKSDLINACTTLGLSPYTSGDVQIQVILKEILGQPNSINQWYTTQAFIQNYYNSGATEDMIGISGQDFLNNTMNWNPDKLAILFMAGYERPSYDPNINHYENRKQYALNWYSYMGGYIPPTPIPTDRKKGFNFVLFNRRRRFNYEQR